MRHQPFEEIGRDHESCVYCTVSPPPRTKRRNMLLLLAAVPVIALTVALLTFKNADRVKPAAYQAYLAAVPYLQRYEKTENLDKAISQLKQATQADSGFALAFAALGEAYLRKFDLTQDRSLLAAGRIQRQPRA